MSYMSIASNVPFLLMLLINSLLFQWYVSCLIKPYSQIMTHNVMFSKDRSTCSYPGRTCGHFLHVPADDNFRRRQHWWLWVLFYADYEISIWFNPFTPFSQSRTCFSNWHLHQSLWWAAFRPYFRAVLYPLLQCFRLGTCIITQLDNQWLDFLRSPLRYCHYVDSLNQQLQHCITFWVQIFCWSSLWQFSFHFPNMWVVLTHTDLKYHWSPSLATGVFQLLG